MQWYSNIVQTWKEVSSVPKFFNLVAERGIVKNIRFYIYCIVLILLCITLVHRNENTQRKIVKTSKQLKALSWEYKDVKSKLMFLTKESELVKNAAPLGLTLSNDVPKKIQVTTNK